MQCCHCLGALCWCTAVADSRRWRCMSLSPLSLCSDQLEVTWLSSPLCPTLRCKVLLQSLPRTLQLHRSYTALCSRSSVKSEVLKGPRGIFLSVDLSSEAGHYHRKEMKGLLEYWMNTLLRIVCIIHIISAYFWPFDRPLFSCQYQFNTSDSGCVRHKGFCFTHPIIRTKMEL